MKTLKPSINTFYLLASCSLSVAAVFVLPLGNSNLSLISFFAAVLVVVFTLVGLIYKKKRVSASRAATVVQAISIIYAVLGLLIVWVLLSQLTAVPKLPQFSDFEYENYLRGFPVIELVLAGSFLNIFYRLTKPRWLVYSGGVLMAASLLIWFIAVHYGHSATRYPL